jgi:hypothetical protein
VRTVVVVVLPGETYVAVGAGSTYVVVVAGREVRSITQPVRLRKIKGSSKNFMW